MFMLLCGCSKKNKDVTPVSSTTTTSNGYKTNGFVKLYGLYNPQPTNYSGITVTVKNSNPVISSVSDSLGLFTLVGLKEGYDTLVFSSNKYSYTPMHSNFGDHSFVIHSSGNADADVGMFNLYEIPNTVVTSLTPSISTSANGKYFYTTGVASQSGSYSGYLTSYARIFVSTDSITSYASPNILFTIPAVLTSNSFSIDSRNLIPAVYLNYPSGTKLFVLAYGAGGFGYVLNETNVYRTTVVMP